MSKIIAWLKTQIFLSAAKQEPAAADQPGSPQLKPAPAAKAHEIATAIYGPHGLMVPIGGRTFTLLAWRECPAKDCARCRETKQMAERN